MLVKRTTWPSSSELYLKVDGQWQPMAAGYSKIDGQWVPWDDGGGIDLNTVIGKKTLSGLQFRLPETA